MPEIFLKWALSLEYLPEEFMAIGVQGGQSLSSRMESLVFGYMRLII